MFAHLEEQLEFEFQFACPYIEAEYYREGAQDLIRRLVPSDLLEEGGPHLPLKRARFADMLPMVVWSDLSRAPCALSVLLLTKYRLNACNFFYDMISRWLLAQKRVNVELFFASDVRLPHLSEELLCVAEIVVHLTSASDVEEVKRNKKQIETEIRLGVVSNYHARRILEFKGHSSDGKTAMIQEKIASLIQSHSKDFDQGIFSQMQHFLVSVRDDFKEGRDYHHISRIISNLHSLRKFILQNKSVYPNKRHVIFKFLKTKITEQGKKSRPVLGVLAGLNFCQENEIFETDHLMSAIGKNLTNVRLVEGSCFVEKGKGDVQTLYLEIEKRDGGDFQLDEIQLLKISLPDLVKSHIEKLAHPIFMPRNEEEVLKNILALSKQLRFVSDMPQVVIGFDEQREKNLYFSVVLVRIVSQSAPSVEELFKKNRARLKYIPDRIRRVGHLRKKYVKEATVFRTCLPCSSYLRSDHSIDLYRARQYIFSELSRVIGSLRDYNGGMIYKLNEALSSLKASLGKSIDPLIVEKFFHAIAPIEMRSGLETDLLKQFFLSFYQVFKTESAQKRISPHAACFVTPGKRGFSLDISPHRWVVFSLDIHGFQSSGVMLISDHLEEKERFLREWD